jgi:hypothetical protein
MAERYSQGVAVKRARHVKETRSSITIAVGLVRKRQ